MGYRTRLGKFPKSMYEKYKNKTFEELLKELADNDRDSLFLGDIEEHFQLTYVDDLSAYDRANWKPFYNFDSMIESEVAFFILGKEDLKNIIECYEKAIYKFYKESLDEIIENPEKGSEKLISFLHNRTCEWESRYCKPYSLRNNGTLEVSKTGIYEHDIFNLANIYQHFDWENDFLIFSGW